MIKPLILHDMNALDEGVCVNTASANNGGVGPSSGRLTRRRAGGKIEASMGSLEFASRDYF
jgi:hypothetical protein